MVLYDRAPQRFRSLNEEEIHHLLRRLSAADPALFKDFEAITNSSGATKAKLKGKGRDKAERRLEERGSVEQTLLTEKFADGQIQLRAARPALLVSSTSWTSDEDFGLLLEALVSYEAAAQEASKAGRDPTCLLLLITGKGPQKAYYEAKIG